MFGSESKKKKKRRGSIDWGYRWYCYWCSCCYRYGSCYRRNISCQEKKKTKHVPACSAPNAYFFARLCGIQTASAVRWGPFLSRSYNVASLCRQQACHYRVLTYKVEMGSHDHWCLKTKAETQPDCVNVRTDKICESWESWIKAIFDSFCRFHEKFLHFYFSIVV